MKPHQLPEGIPLRQKISHQFMKISRQSTLVVAGGGPDPQISLASNDLEIPIRKFGFYNFRQVGWLGD